MKLSSTGVRCNQVLAYFMADTIMHPLKYLLGTHSSFREEQGHQAELAPHNHNKLIRVCTASVLHAGLWWQIPVRLQTTWRYTAREHPARFLSFIFRSGGICMLSAVSRRSQPAKCQYHTIFHRKLWIVWLYIFCCQSSSNGMYLLSPAVTLKHTYWNTCRKNLLLLTLHHSSWSSPAPRARGCLFRTCLNQDVIPSPRFSKQQ